MNKDFTIVSFIEPGTNLVQAFEGINNFLAKGLAAKVQLFAPQSLEKTVSAQAGRTKSVSQHMQAGKLAIEYLQPREPFTPKIDTDSNWFLIIKPAYITALNQFAGWYAQNNTELDNQKLYVLNPAGKKDRFFNRLRMRLFNSAREQGLANGFVFFGQPLAQELFSLKNINENNFSFRIGTYMALSGKGINEINLSAKPVESKIGFITSLVNAIDNTWQWMVKKPVEVLRNKETSIGITSRWDPGHPMWRFIFFIVASIAFILFPLLSFHFGMTWDEYGDHEYTKRILAYYMSFGEDKSYLKDDNSLFVHLVNYGTSVNLISAFLAKYISPFGEYETRHIVCSFFGFLCVLYAGRTGKLLGNWQVAVVILLLMLVSPHFFGQSMNNPKDGPFAAGYMISLYYMICFLKEPPNPSRKTMLLMTVAFGFFTSIRIGGLLVVAYLGLFMSLYWFYITFKNGIKNTSKYLGPFALNYILIAVGTYILAIILWPWAMQAPLTNPFKALNSFTNWQNIFNYELFEGKILSVDEKPWYYLPKYVGIQTPVFILFGVFIFLVLLVWKSYRRNLIFWLILLFAIIFPPTYAIIKHSSLYNGWRQFLFIYPPLVVLSGFGWVWWARVFKKPGIRAAFYAKLSIAIVHTGYWMVKNHPNQYMYFNELVGGPSGAYSYYEMDYYSNSMKQAADWFTENVGTDKPYVISTNNETHTAEYYMKKENPKASMLWTKDFELFDVFADYAFITSRTMAHSLMHNGFFPPKGTVHTINVGGAPILAIVKREDLNQAWADKYFSQGKYDSALYHARKALQYDENVETLRKYAMCCIVNDSLPQAKAALQKCLSIYPEGFAAYELMGEVYFKEGDLPKADEYFRKSLTLRENNALAHRNLGASLYTQKKYGEAMVSFENALKHTEPTAEYVAHITDCYIRLEKYDKAIESASRALRLNPYHAESYKHLAIIYEAKGDLVKREEMRNRWLQLSGQAR